MANNIFILIGMLCGLFVQLDAALAQSTRPLPQLGAGVSAPSWNGSLLGENPAGLSTVRPFAAQAFYSPGRARLSDVAGAWLGGRLGSVGLSLGLMTADELDGPSQVLWGLGGKLANSQVALGVGGSFLSSGGRTTSLTQLGMTWDFAPRTTLGAVLFDAYYSNILGVGVRHDFTSFLRGVLDVEFYHADTSFVLLPGVLLHWQQFAVSLNYWKPVSYVEGYLDGGLVVQVTPQLAVEYLFNIIHDHYFGVILSL